MPCVRCQADASLNKAGWCADCEQAYDTWVRRHATDIIWSVMGGGVLLGAIGIGLPLLGISSAVAFAAAFVGLGAAMALQRAAGRRRRRQFLAGGAMPRAYLPAPRRPRAYLPAPR
jgi:hypothetical protein